MNTLITTLVVLAALFAVSASAANNCPGAAGSAGVNCTSASLCCGYGSISPSCLPADGSKQCCIHYLSATQCDPSQVCGGGGGPGASSYAQCGPANSTFCDKGTGQGAFCSAAQPTCCGYNSGYGFCCAAGCACNNSYYTCACPAATSAPTTAAPTTAPVRNNCPAYGGNGGLNCSDASLCCGYGSISPSCLPADGSKKCCTHYLSATQCTQDQVCGGSGGPGASSYAQCGPANSTFCDKGDGQGAFCTAAQPTCCGYYGAYGFCCAPGCACNNSYYTCSCPAATSAPTTSTPTTQPPATAAPVQNNCPAWGGSGGVNCSDPSLCCGYGTITPSCLPANGSKQCCVWFKSATQCNPDQVCGGSYGPGASSYAQCGPANTTFCNKGDGSNAFCSASQPTCCGNYGSYAYCCAPGCACNNSYYTCSCPSTAAPTTRQPTTHKPTTHKPTTHKPTTHAPTTRKPATQKPTVKPTVKATPKPKTCPAKGKGGLGAVCAAGNTKCCGAPGKNAFCCKQNQRCNNNKGICM